MVEIIMKNRMIREMMKGSKNEVKGRGRFRSSKIPWEEPESRDNKI